jgi:hypothetical protein
MAAGSKREHACLLLAGGTSIVRTARTVGMSERGLHKWLADPIFVARIDTLRSQMTERAMGKLTRNMTAAAKVLGELLADKDSRVRLHAARAILENGVKLRDGVEQEKRLKALEDYVASRKGKRS